jgi:hypothetical protein
MNGVVDIRGAASANISINLCAISVLQGDNNSLSEYVLVSQIPTEIFEAIEYTPTRPGVYPRFGAGGVVQCFFFIMYIASKLSHVLWLEVLEARGTRRLGFPHLFRKSKWQNKFA